MRLQDKVAVITGASRGIGREIALRFAHEGCQVIVNYHTNAAAAAEVQKQITACGQKALAVKADVSSRIEVRQMLNAALEAFGRIDILVNNAGILKQLPFEEITDEEWDRMQAVCLKGAFITSQEIFPHFKDRHSGRIINIASMGGQFGGPKAPHYAAAKAGLICFTKSTARIMASYGVNANCISPGFVATDMSTKEIDSLGGKDAVGKAIPVGRVGQPQDIATAAVFLASNESAFVTGHVLNVNGGMYMP
ncbi:3-oxoacyl-ACP reductase family protein [Syntrophorhabdus aromaticivorans]|uniref:3-oxoacyl-ACP reductase FabG n=1 Tax=Syntrophorhabdus aromaticivorans TaxID=328301 RepID=A0A351U2W4_9BACT|nr:3-oxoacyl-ACP reductase family protein [Syntrophorhabdus aromaticivorans]NLW35665.1 3-oxoacyl-ACP reductase FabG [Syntrophorhabdus aromaticivorans]HBA54295.1 3-oxoacyl-ACP reductase FabG [Syntrophorhabdus aromaticivorans]